MHRRGAEHTTAATKPLVQIVQNVQAVQIDSGCLYRLERLEGLERPQGDYLCLRGEYFFTVNPEEP
jgi:hypothetical protein